MPAETVGGAPEAIVCPIIPTRLLSRCAQFPEYVPEGHYAAAKSRNPTCVLYLNPGSELR